MKENISKLKNRAAQIRQDIFVLIEVYKHPKTPALVTFLSMLVVAYAFSPIDLIPDFIPVLGYLDDVILLPLGIVLILKLVPPDVLAECRERVKSLEKVGRKNWTAGIVVLLIWTGLLYWAVAAFINA